MTTEKAFRQESRGLAVRQYTALCVPTLCLPANVPLHVYVEALYALSSGSARLSLFLSSHLSRTSPPELCVYAPSQLIVLHAVTSIHTYLTSHKVGR